MVVSDVRKAKKFFIETLGLVEHANSEEWGWVELGGQDGGSLMGIAQSSDDMPAGQNAVITWTVDHLEETVAALKEKGVQMIGEIIEVPNHVKLQLFIDADGNRFQLVETLS